MPNAEYPRRAGYGLWPTPNVTSHSPSVRHYLFDWLSAGAAEFLLGIELVLVIIDSVETRFLCEGNRFHCVVSHSPPGVLLSRLSVPQHYRMQRLTE